MDYNKKELYTAKRSSNINVDDESISITWDQLRSDSSSVNWLLLHLVQPIVVAVKSFGSGGITEFIHHLTNDDILFGALRCKVGGSIKFIHIYFVGSDVGALKKGKASMYESGIFQALDGAHGKIQFVNGLEEITGAKISSEIQNILNTTFPIEH